MLTRLPRGSSFGKYRRANVSFINITLGAVSYRGANGFRLGVGSAAVPTIDIVVRGLQDRDASGREYLAAALETFSIPEVTVNAAHVEYGGMSFDVPSLQLNGLSARGLRGTRITTPARDGQLRLI